MTPDIFLAACGSLAGWLAHAAAGHRRLRAARHDPVTGLPTRTAWTKRAQKILRRGHHLVVLIDLDRFKHVNDTHGHAAGDHVLAITAARLRAWTGHAGGGACGRLGGDEFAIVTRSQAGGRELGDLAAMLAAAITLPSGERIPGGASIGAAACAPATALSSALGEADAAMYQAKRCGGGWRLTASTARRVNSPARRTRHHGPQQPAATSPGRRPAPATQGK
jgi:diguanylate cyclase (GGDEF)-like protein